MAFTFSYFKMLMRNKNMDAIKYLPTFSFITTTARSNSNFLALFYVEKKKSVVVTSYHEKLDLTHHDAFT